MSKKIVVNEAPGNPAGNRTHSSRQLPLLNRNPRYRVTLASSCKGIEGRIAGLGKLAFSPTVHHLAPEHSFLAFHI